MNVKWKKQCKKFNILTTHKILKFNFYFETKFNNNSNYPNVTSWKHFQIHSKYFFEAMGPISFHIFVNFSSPQTPKVSEKQEFKKYCMLIETHTY